MVASFLKVLMLFPFLYAAPPLRFDEQIEHEYHPAYLRLATGDLHARRSNTLHPWPVQYKSIGHTIASYQYYGFREANGQRLADGAYFHHGLDIRADAGSPVLASAGGKIVDIENYEPGNPAYWEIAILDDEGFIWQYHHVEHSSIPQEIYDAYHSGTPIAAGSKLGEVYYWGVVTFGERYHHCHLNVIGKNQQYLNGFAFLTPLADASAPVVKEISLLQNGQRVEGDTVSGNYNLMAEVDDLILSNVFVVPPNSISYSVDGGAEQSVWQFDSLPGGSSDTKYVQDFYVPGEVCGDYECRRPVINLGFKPEGRQAFPTTPGSHKIVVTAKDFAGNVGSKEFTWKVQ